MLAAYDEIRSTLFNEEEWSEKMQKAYEAVKQKNRNFTIFVRIPCVMILKGFMIHSNLM